MTNSAIDFEFEVIFPTVWTMTKCVNWLDRLDRSIKANESFQGGYIQLTGCVWPLRFYQNVHVTLFPLKPKEAAAA